jgi:hypothetical protein
VNTTSAGPDLLKGPLEIPRRQESVPGEIRRRNLQHLRPGTVPLPGCTVAPLASKDVVLVARQGAPWKLGWVGEGREVGQSRGEGLKIDDGQDVLHVGMLGSRLPASARKSAWSLLTAAPVRSPADEVPWGSNGAGHHCGTIAATGGPVTRPAHGLVDHLALGLFDAQLEGRRRLGQDPGLGWGSGRWGNLGVRATRPPRRQRRTGPQEQQLGPASACQPPPFGMFKRRDPLFSMPTPGWRAAQGQRPGADPLILSAEAKLMPDLLSPRTIRPARYRGAQ